MNRSRERIGKTQPRWIIIHRGDSDKNLDLVTSREEATKQIGENRMLEGMLR